MGLFVAADPYPYPYNGDLRPENTVLIAIDMQTDFCGIGGYVDKMGYDLSLTRAPIAPIKRLLVEMRSRGFPIFPNSRLYLGKLSSISLEKGLSTPPISI